MESPGSHEQARSIVSSNSPTAEQPPAPDELKQTIARLEGRLAELEAREHRIGDSNSLVVRSPSEPIHRRRRRHHRPWYARVAQSIFVGRKRVWLFVGYVILLLVVGYLVTDCIGRMTAVTAISP